MITSDNSVTVAVGFRHSHNLREPMTKRFRLFQRGTIYYAHDAETGRQVSLKTRDKRQAERLLLAKNEADEQPLMNLALARTCLAA